MGKRQRSLEGMAMTPDFWRGKRVFLTGHTGFKGGWLSLWLQKLDANVTGYALQSSTLPSLFEIAKVGDGMRSIFADVRDLALLRKAMHDAQPEIVIHMAAQPLVRYSYQNPVETYATNVMGTVHLLEAVRHTPSVRAVVNVTTDKCYENREWVWGYRESDPLGGYDPYSNSKGCAELVSASYRSSFFNSMAAQSTAIATVRAGNVIGGGDWTKDRLIPDILAAFEAGQTVKIRRPQAVRPWQHVLEPLRGYLTLAERLYYQEQDYAEGWNFGPNDEDARPVAWIVDKMAVLWGAGATWQIDDAEHPHEAGYLKLDISKARSRLNWNPALNLTQALEWIVDWSRARKSGTDMRYYTQLQIHNYQALTCE
jgi:CDP-glucose 4,6-dehydratase